MTRPGDRLHGLATCLCSAETMARFIEPVIADLQAEHREAMRHGRLWRSRWIRLAGCFAFVKVITLCACRAAWASRHGWTADERKALGRTLAFSTMSTAALTVLLGLPFLTLVAHPRSVDVRLLLYLVPQALPIAVTIGATAGILFGLSGRLFSRRVIGWVLALAVAASVSSFINMGWVTPAANQAFRVLVSGRADLEPGAPELSLGELGRQVDLAARGRATTFPSDPRYLAFNYHSRLALSWSPLIFALFALAIISNRSRKRLVLGVAACAAFFAYYMVLYGARSLVLDGAVPAYAAAWTPNVSIVLVAATLALVPREPSALSS